MRPTHSHPIHAVGEVDPESTIPLDEFRVRQDRARAAAAERGVDGLIIWSRGGAPIDQAADLVYLANFYTQQPFIADHVGIGSARCHGALDPAARRSGDPRHRHPVVETGSHRRRRRAPGQRCRPTGG